MQNSNRKGVVANSIDTRVEYYSRTTQLNRSSNMDEPAIFLVYQHRPDKRTKIVPDTRDCVCGNHECPNYCFDDCTGQGCGND